MLRCYICNRPIELPTNPEKKECLVCRYEIDKASGKIPITLSYQAYYDMVVVDLMENINMKNEK